MSTPPDTLDQLARGYLDAVEHGLAGLPEDRRRELLADLRDHIAAERAALDSPTEAALRAILDRLGEPATLAAEARLIEDSPVVPSPVVSPAGRSQEPWLKPRGWILAALGLLLLIVLLLGFAVSTGGHPHSVRPAPAPASAQSTPR